MICSGDGLERLWERDFSPEVQHAVDQVKTSLSKQSTRICSCGTSMVYNDVSDDNMRGTVGNFFCPSCDVALC